MTGLSRRIGAAAVAVVALGLVLPSTAAGAAPSRAPSVAAAPGTPGAGLPGAGTPGAGLLQSVSPEVRRAVADGSLPLRLVTGDRVEIGIGTGGAPVVKETTPAPRADGSAVVFHTLTRDGTVYVIPNDALSLLDTVLDWELFNLAKLAEHVARGTVGEIPAIVTHHDAAGTRQAPELAGATVTHTFASIDASAVMIPADGTWWRRVRAATGDQPAEPGARNHPLAGVDKVWLDGLAQVALEESVPQIDAPEAWNLGLDGTGVTVAVLDSGIDPTHPDVAGNIAGMVDFTGDPKGALDGHGHGTHVASTIAGTGAASGGLRRGVAPGADLLIGKVCDDAGFCQESAIIAGMQWAASSRAEVVNMSLGGGATDGTDPMSMAVNQLSEQSGTLFVIAAGNSGPDPYTVASPGAADAALTVAAVDKAGEMARFSSRGPRVGDDAAKPDIAAPGVSIVAARATGTQMGTVVDERYVAASGTSMATPHVAGAAAIVAQQSPELTGQELKALLMTTAADLGHGLYEQGAGRVDVGRAVDPGLVDDGPLNFGRLTFPYQPVSDTITYSNATDQPVTLTLAGSFSGPDGAPAPEGMFTLGSDQVTVPAHGSAEVTVALDASQLSEQLGRYRGAVTATDPAGAVRETTPVTVFVEPERFRLTVQLVPPAGAEAISYGNAVVVAMDAGNISAPAIRQAAAEFSLDLFAGVYTIHTVVEWTDPAGERQIGVPVLPEVAVAGSATTVRMDLNQAQPLRVRAPEPTQTHQLVGSVVRTSADGTTAVQTEAVTSYGTGERNWWWLPTGEVSTGTLAFDRSVTLVPPPVTMRVLGGGKPSALDARYQTADVSVRGGEQFWREHPGQNSRILGSRTMALPVPRLAGLRVAPVVYAGPGSAADFADLDAQGALVLLTPTDVCSSACPLDALRERVARAAQAGAIGVLVSGVEGRPELVGPDPVSEECMGGDPASCPAIEPYAALPLLTVPATEAAGLIRRLERNDAGAVEVLIRGQAETSRAYVSASAHDAVPADLAVSYEPGDLARVEHRFLTERPGEVDAFVLSRLVDDGGTLPRSVAPELPLVASQRSVTLFVAPDPLGREVADYYTVTTREWVAPFAKAFPPPKAAPLKPGESSYLPKPFMRQLVLPGDRTLSWHYTGLALPGASPAVVTEPGWKPFQFNLCAGCREGDTLWPVMYLTTANGTRTDYSIGVNNDRGLLTLQNSSRGCDPPHCQLRLVDEAGTEYAQTLKRVDGVSGSGGAVAGAGLPGAGAPTVPPGGLWSQLAGLAAGLVDERVNP